MFKETYRKTTFAINEPYDPSDKSKPFLLIVCTGCIFTWHNDKVYFYLNYIRVAPDTTDFPAYSQILLKQISYFNTVIVTADVHWKLEALSIHNCLQIPAPLTFQHWSGFSPYTSSYELAGTCVFGKQSPGDRSLRPRKIAGEGLSRSYTRLFA